MTSVADVPAPTFADPAAGAAPVGAAAAGTEPAPFDCPRCGVATVARFYGPCEECRAALRALGGVARDVTAARFEPKLNVTPNAVALKD